MLHQSSTPEMTSQRYWGSKLKGMNIINLPGVYTHPASADNIVSLSVPIDSNILAQFRAGTNHQTDATEQTLVANIILLLQRYMNDSDITIGVISEATPCMPLRSTETADTTFAAFRSAINTLLQEGRQNHLSLDGINKLLPTPLRASLRSPHYPFDVLISLSHSDKSHLLNLKQPGLFHIEFSNLDTEPACSIHYAAGSLSKEHAQRILDHIKNGLCAIAANPDIHAADIAVLTRAELEQVAAYNHTLTANRFPGMSIGDLLQQVATEVPERVAMIYQPANNAAEISMTYRELNERSLQIAYYLRETLQLNEGQVVVLSITRRADLYAYVLGIMRAGLVFLPLETTRTNVFKQRLGYTDAAIYLVDNQTDDMFVSKPNRVNVDHADVQASIKSKATAYRPFFTYHPDKKAYIMFSSGTSSKGLKASVLTHGSYNNLMTGLACENFAGGGNSQESDDNLSIMHNSPFNFDASIYDLLLQLVKRGKIVFTCEEDRLSSTVCADLVRKHQIQYAATLPKFIRKLPSDLANIFKRITIMGQSAEAKITDEWHRINPALWIDIGFGPTECGICTHLHKHNPLEPAARIGRPVANMKVTIVNPNTLAICGPGMIGEMLFSGPGLAESYLNNPALTAEKFVWLKPNLISQRYVRCNKGEADATLFYRSGDTGFYTKDEDGTPNLEFIGRTDRTVKIYGVTANLDAIEASIMTNPKVKDAAVVAVKHPSQELVWIYAFVCMHSEADEAEIKFELREWLKSEDNPIAIPEVAYPQFVPCFNTMEITNNGKTNYKKYELIAETLSLEERTKMTSHSSHEEMVSYLLGLWSDTLVQKLSEDDTDQEFLLLGGNSQHLAILEAKINITLSLAKEYEIYIGAEDDKLSPTMTIDSLATALVKKVECSRLTQDGRQLQQSLRESASNVRSMLMFAPTEMNRQYTLSQNHTNSGLDP